MRVLCILNCKFWGNFFHQIETAKTAIEMGFDILTIFDNIFLSERSVGLFFFCNVGPAQGGTTANL